MTGLHQIKHDIEEEEEFAWGGGLHMWSYWQVGVGGQEPPHQIVDLLYYVGNIFLSSSSEKSYPFNF